MRDIQRERILKRPIRQDTFCWSSLKYSVRVFLTYIFLVNVKSSNRVIYDTGGGEVPDISPSFLKMVPKLKSLPILHAVLEIRKGVRLWQKHSSLFFGQSRDYFPSIREWHLFTARDQARDSAQIGSSTTRPGSHHWPCYFRLGRGCHARGHFAYARWHTMCSSLYWAWLNTGHFWMGELQRVDGTGGGSRSESRRRNTMGDGGETQVETEEKHKRRRRRNTRGDGGETRGETEEKHKRRWRRNTRGDGGETQEEMEEKHEGRRRRNSRRSRIGTEKKVKRSNRNSREVGAGGGAKGICRGRNNK